MTMVSSMAMCFRSFTSTEEREIVHVYFYGENGLFGDDCAKMSTRALRNITLRACLVLESTLATTSLSRLLASISWRQTSCAAPS